MTSSFWMLGSQVKDEGSSCLRSSHVSGLPGWAPVGVPQIFPPQGPLCTGLGQTPMFHPAPYQGQRAGLPVQFGASSQETVMLVFTLLLLPWRPPSLSSDQPKTQQKHLHGLNFVVVRDTGHCCRAYATLYPLPLGPVATGGSFKGGC